MVYKNHTEHCGSWEMFSLKWLLDGCIPTEARQWQKHQRWEKKPLSNSSFHSHNVKSFTFTRMDMCENICTESCFFHHCFASVYMKKQTYANMPWGACFPAESTLKELITELLLCLPFPKLWGLLWSQSEVTDKSIGEIASASWIGKVYWCTSHHCRIASVEKYGKRFSSTEPLLHFFMSKKSSGKPK